MAILGGWRLTRAGVLFVIGILVLGGLVTGGIFLVKNHGEAVRRDEAVKVAEQNLKDQSEVATQPIASDTSKDNDKTDTKPAETVIAAQTQATELPETGPSGPLNVLIVTILALSVSFYVASRRAVSRL